MLSVGTCRKLLRGVDGSLSDAEIERLRDQLAMIAESILDDSRRVPHAAASARGAAFAALSPDLAEEVAERAAIMEFDGGATRDVAERFALLRVVRGRAGG